MIYAHGDTALYLNLFIPSVVTWADKGLAVRQETGFPEQSASRLTISAREPVTLDLKIRQPAWAQPGITVKVNGETVTGTPADGYVTVRREWRDGDTVTLGLPMALRTESLPGVPETVAFLYGPIVLAGEFGAADLPPNNQEARDQHDFLKLPVPAEPVLVGAANDLVSHLERVPGRPLTFLTQGLGHPADVTLRPFYQLHHQRYGIYWAVLSPAEWQARQSGVSGWASTSMRNAAG